MSKSCYPSDMQGYWPSMLRGCRTSNASEVVANVESRSCFKKIDFTGRGRGTRAMMSEGLTQGGRSRNPSFEDMNDQDKGVAMISTSTRSTKKYLRSTSAYIIFRGLRSHLEIIHLAHRVVSSALKIAESKSALRTRSTYPLLEAIASASYHRSCPDLIIDVRDKQGIKRKTGRIRVLLYQAPHVMRSPSYATPESLLYSSATIDYSFWDNAS
ncbi:hypothetical protein ARMSODRAFT_975891 [Armillaria solidipes]|uniref:Uncharacterized protein n=1 Tax=Armillaria solidipes TaxID=1076256 RepID=A0A2H3BHS4_9AGAR|nr:hypothetical protein ARMSODRAFT_975891 [Armillaria solidipes]